MNKSNMLADLVQIVQYQREELIRLRKLASITREAEKELRTFLPTPLIKVIVGPRRAGKSMLCIRVLSDYNHAYLNFDDDRLADLETTELIIPALQKVYPDGEFLLFDEIQNLPNWERFVSKLHRAGYNLVLTGSNAHLLSGELATALTGRHQSIELLPLSFLETATAKWPQLAKRNLQDSIMNSNLLDDYLINGGFPEPRIHAMDPAPYLRTLFESILYKDIVKRHRIRNPKAISNLGYLLANSVASTVGIERIAKSAGIGSTATVHRLFGFLEQCYLFFLLEPYSHKTRSQLRSPRKSYLIDPGLATALARTTAPRQARMLENVVFLELVRRGYQPNFGLFYYRTRAGHEVDFVLKNSDSIQELIQVSYSLVDPGTLSRELRALNEAASELKCSAKRIITFDASVDLSQQELEGVKVEPIISWLLQPLNTADSG